MSVKVRVIVRLIVSIIVKVSMMVMVKVRHSVWDQFQVMLRMRISYGLCEHHGQS